MNPYRDECPECMQRKLEDEARAQAARTKLENFDSLPTCPMCGDIKVQRGDQVCSGNSVFVYRTGIWPFRKKHVLRCEIPGIRAHFHCRCLSCKATWMMETKIESDFRKIKQLEEIYGYREIGGRIAIQGRPLPRPPVPLPEPTPYYE